MPVGIFKRGFAVHILLVSFCTMSAQFTETKSLIYNSLVGGVTGGIGSLVNKKQGERRTKAFLKGFVTGAGGGVLMYAGKKTNELIVRRERMGWAWGSRMIFSAGNSIVENAAENRPFWSRWHYDVAFVRIGFNAVSRNVTAEVLPGTFSGMIFIALKATPDARNSLLSGTLIFRRGETLYSPGLSAVTAGNTMLLHDTLSGLHFYEVFAHEMVHVYQFQEFSGVNALFSKPKERYAAASHDFRQLDRWVYGDLNHTAMLLNYFIFQKGYSLTHYEKNFLEQEAEYLPTGKQVVP